MTGLSWNEINRRAYKFACDWDGVLSERAEAQTFWNEFFQVFGIRRRTVASFEEPVRNLQGNFSRIDLLWGGKLLAEHKSAGEDLGKAKTQAFRYIQQLASEGRHDEIPRYIVVTNFDYIILYDLEPDTGRWMIKRNGYNYVEFPVTDLPLHVHHFYFMIGRKIHRFGEEDEANVRAAEIMAALHDQVSSGRYDPHSLERLLVRFLFCLFAEDTGIFEPSQFELYIENRTNADGSDLGAQLNSLFDVLNTKEDARSRHLDEDLAAFPYINGDLFSERLPTPAFSSDMRKVLVSACRFDWSRISPAIFGSLFQGILDAKERRQIGAHYTSERDILKVIRPLFLDELRIEFDQIKALKQRKVRDQRLIRFQERLAGMNFLDPACGCGNFLVIAYRELRRLEHELIILRYGENQSELAAGEEIKLSKVDVHQFYGIEIGEWPARIAETALWLTDHQMNIELSHAVGNLFQRIPLKASPHIRCGNALRIDWNELLPAKKCSFVFGNPPFVGKKEQNTEQKHDHAMIWSSVKGARILDYVTCWYVVALRYIQGSKIQCAFVSTNSIAQGEQVGILWRYLSNEYGASIHFAYRTFPWKSEARGAAHVHVVIIGFACYEVNEKWLYLSNPFSGQVEEVPASRINAYLADAPQVIIEARSSTLCAVRAISYGSMMIDKPRSAGPEQGLIIDDEERMALLEEQPGLDQYIRPLYGGDEYIGCNPRWCLWLVDAPASVIRKSSRLMRRIENVRTFRMGSNRVPTQRLADRPHLFGEIRQPNVDYLLIPKVSSSTRDYIPMGFLPPTSIASGSALVISGATHFDFGVLTSCMHMIWVDTVGGRMKSDYQYSAKLVYNNFPWPVDATDAQRAKVEECAQAVLDCRVKHMDLGATLADLYDPLVMPVDLRRAHETLDRAVDRCYRKAVFKSERERLAFLLGLYEQLTTLFTTAPVKKGGRRRK